ncbi:hypothetical protein ACIBMZ_08220 [Micromonospora sp. NPDC049900]|uniref:hypothetical protein n=1 Tax=Micromonospora sp. NPDC049900 TaxID=3364275 RepID=UPI00378E8CFA
MGIDATLFCLCRRVQLVLGKPVRNSWDDIIYFAYAHPSAPNHSQSREMSGALWKIFAEHVGHQLQVIYDSQLEYDEMWEPPGPPAMIGGDEPDDIEFSDYLAGWPEDSFADYSSNGWDVSKTGHLACFRCRERLCLGQAVRDAGGRVLFFHHGGPEAPANSQQPVLNRAAWRFLARHATHEMPILVGPPYDRDIDGYVEIGGQRPDDVPFDDYLANWPG